MQKILTWKKKFFLHAKCVPKKNSTFNSEGGNIVGRYTKYIWIISFQTQHAQKWLHAHITRWRKTGYTARRHTQIGRLRCTRTGRLVFNFNHHRCPKLKLKFNHICQLNGENNSFAKSQSRYRWRNWLFPTLLRISCWNFSRISNETWRELLAMLNLFFPFFRSYLKSPSLSTMCFNSFKVTWLIWKIFIKHWLTPDQAQYMTAAIRHLDSAQRAAAAETREAARKLAIQQQVKKIAPHSWMNESLNVHKTVQSWALSVFFNFFNNKKWFCAFFIKLIK